MSTAVHVIEYEAPAGNGMILRSGELSSPYPLKSIM